MMSTAPSETRISALEEAMGQLARAQARTETSVARLSEEMAAFKQEGATLRERSAQEMADFRERMEASRQREAAISERSAREMAEFREEMRVARQESNRKWGELSNKMGTLVEDIIYPSIPEIFRKAFGQTQEPDCAIRVTRHHRTDPSRRREFDAVASAQDIFLINETRSRLVPSAIPAFIEVLQEAREFFPEAEGKKVVGAMATFHMDSSLVRSGERKGLLMLGLGSGLMEILNASGFEPRAF